MPIYILMMALGAGTLTLAPLTSASLGLVRLVERCLAWQANERPSFREILHALENEYKVVRGKAAGEHLAHLFAARRAPPHVPVRHLPRP